jgi:hypothetical protein
VFGYIESILRHPYLTARLWTVPLLEKETLCEGVGYQCCFVVARLEQFVMCQCDKMSRAWCRVVPCVVVKQARVSLIDYLDALFGLNPLTGLV